MASGNTEHRTSRMVTIGSHICKVEGGTACEERMYATQTREVLRASRKKTCPDM